MGGLLTVTAVASATFGYITGAVAVNYNVHNRLSLILCGFGVPVFSALGFSIFLLRRKTKPVTPPDLMIVLWAFVLAMTNGFIMGHVLGYLHH